MHCIKIMMHPGQAQDLPRQTSILGAAEIQRSSALKVGILKAAHQGSNKLISKIKSEFLFLPFDFKKFFFTRHCFLCVMQCWNFCFGSKVVMSLKQQQLYVLARTAWHDLSISQVNPLTTCGSKTVAGWNALVRRNSDAAD